MARPLSTTFKSVKPHNVNLNLNRNALKSSSSHLPFNKSPPPPPPSSSSKSKSKSKSKSRCSSTQSSSKWSVYLILSTNPPIKTYVGVTTNFPRRLKQHNGELQGGAKASRSGRPWVCACLIQGFPDKSQACVFESKWKSFSRKLERKSSREGQEADNISLQLLRHREAALARVEESIDCNYLKIDWHLNL